MDELEYRLREAAQKAAEHEKAKRVREGHKTPAEIYEEPAMIFGFPVFYPDGTPVAKADLGKEQMPGERN